MVYKACLISRLSATGLAVQEPHFFKLSSVRLLFGLPLFTNGICKILKVLVYFFPKIHEIGCVA